MVGELLVASNSLGMRWGCGAERGRAQEGSPEARNQGVPPQCRPVALRERKERKCFPVQLCMLYFPSESGP